MFVDLERRETFTAYTPVGVTRTLLAGRGANMYYLYRLLDETLSPLHPDIPLIFGSGLLTGLVPSAARGNCTSWSPESGVLLDANAGDYLPSFLRMNGFDHLVLYGKAAAWTTVMIATGCSRSRTARRTRAWTTSTCATRWRATPAASGPATWRW